MSENNITVTQNAAKKVWELIEEEGNFDLKLRVYVTGGGCSGFQYGFAFAETVNDDDSIFTRAVDSKENSSIQVLIDPISLPYLNGSEIDYKQDIEGEHFIIRNPNAKTTCGCGSSFSA